MNRKRLKLAVAFVAAHGVMVPLFLLLAVMLAGHGLKQFFRWAAVDRVWSNALLDAAERIEAWGRR